MKLLKYVCCSFISSGLFFIFKISSLGKYIGHISPLLIELHSISNITCCVIFLGNVQVTLNSLGSDKYRLKFILSSVTKLL